jgi:hypothetical protein
MPQRKTKTSFKKNNKNSVGNKGNLNPKADREERIVKKVDAGLISRYLNINSHLTVQEMQAKLKDAKSLSFLEYMTIRGMVVAAQTGDTNRLNFFYDRMIGKVPQKIEHGVADPFEGKTNEELIEIKRKLEATNRQTLKHIEQLPRYQEQSAQAESEFRELEARGEIEPAVIDTTDKD